MSPDGGGDGAMPSGGGGRRRGGAAGGGSQGRTGDAEDGADDRMNIMIYISLTLA